jgi:glycosyltransferase involved in cell wall biosynthesis
MREALPRVVYIYFNSHGRLAADVAGGRAADTTLHGQNHLREFGIDARVHDPLLTRRQLPSPLAAAAWNLRELTLPWEVGDADVACSTLGRLFPLAARARRRPRVAVLDFGYNLTYARNGRARRRLLRASLASAAAIICLGESQRRRLLAQIDLPPGRVHTVLGAVDASFFRPQPSPPEVGLYVLAVGKDLARDYATLFEAIRTLGVRLEIVAPPRAVAGLRLPPNARVRYGVSWEQLRALYAGAACVVVPQRHDFYRYGTEAGGLSALLEAMAMARPTVASERAILAEYVTHGHTALVAPPESPAHLRAAIEHLLDDRPFASSLGAAARADVERRLTTRHEAGRLAPIFRAIAAR